MLKNGLKKLSAVLAISAVAVALFYVPSNAMFGTRDKGPHFYLENLFLNIEDIRNSYNDFIQYVKNLEISRYGNEVNYRQANDDSNSTISSRGVLDLSALELSGLTRTVLLGCIVETGAQNIPNLNIRNFDSETQDLIRKADELFYLFLKYRQIHNGF